MKKKNAFRRWMSFLTALSLVVALLPAAPAAHGEDGVVEYLFAPNSYLGDVQSANTQVRQMSEYSGERNWAYVGDTANFFDRSNFLQIVPMVGNWAALRVQVPAAGRYQVSMYAYHAAACGVTGLYMFPLTPEIIPQIGQCLVEENQIGAVEHYAASPFYQTDAVGVFEAENAGEYLMVFRGEGLGAGGANYIYPISVTMELTGGLAGVRLQIGEDGTMKVGQGIRPTVQALDANGSAMSLKGAEISLSVEKKDVAWVDGDGKLYALSEGETDVTATVTLDGETLSQTVRLTVAGKQAPLAGEQRSYSFYLQAYPGESSSDINQYTEYTDQRHWAFVATDVTAADGVTLQGIGIQMLSQFQEWCALKIRVPAAGRYRASLEAYGNSNAGTVGVYLLPYSQQAAGDIPGCLTRENLLQKIDTYRLSAGTSTYPMEELSFAEEGEYLLIFQSQQKSPAAGMGGGNYSFLKSLSLDGVTELDRAELRLDTPKLGVGESTGFAASAYLSNGEAVDLSAATIEYFADDPESCKSMRTASASPPSGRDPQGSTR